MKKIKTFLLSFLMLFFSIFILTACGGTKLPTNNYEKVKYAFNGVEKSFKNKKSLNNGSNDYLRLLSFNPTQTDLDTIKGIYTDGDNQGNKIDDIEYDEPPMIQFQYIKKVLEKVGSDYKFGTKYYDDIEGTIYIDMENGKEMSGEEYKATYLFKLSIDINIDSNDLINADVSFDISVTQGSKTYNTNWFVTIILDYDMENKTPNYKMTMLTNNQENELPTRLGYTYEYDYVEVVDSKIKEWRKFCFETDKLLVKDSTHTSFDDYLNENIEYDTSTCKWYFDKNLYKITRKTVEKSEIVGKALFNMGLNYTDIDPTSFTNKEGEKNSVIKTCYDDFCKIYKKDIIYSMLTSEEHGDHGGEATISGLRIMNSDATGGFENISVNDEMIIDLVKGFDDAYGEHQSPQVYYIDGDGGLLDRVNVDELTFLFAIYDDSDNLLNEIQVQNTANVKKCFEDAMIINNVTTNNNKFMLILKDDSRDIRGGTVFYYAGDTPSVNNNVFPEAAISYGIPKYEASDNVDFQLFTNTDGSMTVNIKNSSDDEANYYLIAVAKAGFINTVDTSSIKEYTKEKGETQIQHLRFEFANSGEYHISSWYETKEVDPGGGGDEPGGDDPEPIIITSVALTGSFSDWSTTTDLIGFEPMDGNRYILNDCILQEGTTFKIICNHSWDINFGFKDVEGINYYPKAFEVNGDENNIKLLKDCRFTLEFNMQLVDGVNKATIVITNVHYEA